MDANRHPADDATWTHLGFTPRIAHHVRPQPHATRGSRGFSRTPLLPVGRGPDAGGLPRPPAGPGPVLARRGRPRGRLTLGARPAEATQTGLDSGPARCDVRTAPGGRRG